VAFSAALLLVGAMLRVSTGTELSLECRREPADVAACVRTEVVPFLGTREWRFLGSEITEVRAAYRPGSKRGSPGHWEVLLIDPRGGETRVATRSDEGDAVALRDRLDRFLRDSSVLGVHLSTQPEWWSPALIVGVGLAALALLASAFAAAGRIRIEVDVAQDALRVTRTLFGIPLGGAEHRLGDFRGVRVEAGEIRDRFRPARSRPAQGWRVALVRPGGNGVAIDDTYRGRRRVHDRCAAELRAALGFAGVDEPSFEEVVSPQSAGFRRVFRLVLLLFGGALLVSLVGNAILSWHANRTQGWLELRATARCKFQGFELLPGGLTRMSLDPGRYEVEIYDPALPGRWERRSFEIRIGEETVVTCRPR
jgi:hypothetical protein